MRPRTFLFVPANRPRMFEHAERSAADRLIVDLEDAVPPGEKAAARDVVADAFSLFTRPAERVLLRVNPEPDAQALDLALAARLPLAGIVVPKVEQPADLDRVNAALDALPATAAARAGTLVALLETPAGVLAAARFAEGSVRRLGALAFGAEDFQAGMGVSAVENGPLLDFARASVAVAAAAAGLLAIDSPTFEFRDPAIVRAATARAHALGFRAKFAIHPAQVATIHEALAPAADERAWARRVIDAYDESTRAGRGTTQVDGRMVDMPTIKRAREILGEDVR